MKKPTLILLGLLSLPAFPVTSHAEDLLEIYRLATQSDPALQAAEADRSAVLEIRPQSRSLLFPSIDFNANISRNRQDIEFSTTDGLGNDVTVTDNPSFTSKSYSLNLVQPVYNAQTFAVLRQADARIGQAEAQFGAVEQDLIVRVATRYFEVLAARDTVEFARAEQAAIARQSEQSRQRFEVGLTAITDVQEAQARFDLAEAQVIAAQNQLAATLEALREVTGQEHEIVASLNEKFTLLSPDPDNIEQWAETAADQNLLVIAFDFAVQAAREEIGRQRAARYPTVDVVGSHTFNDSGGGRFGSSQIEGTAIGIQLNAPLFRGRLFNSRIREAEFRTDQARELAEQQQRAAVRQARAAYLSVLNNISRVKALQQAVVSNQTALEATEAGLEVGFRTAVDVLDAQRELFRARTEFARARYDYVLDTLRLKQAAGTLTAADIEQINIWLQ